MEANESIQWIISGAVIQISMDHVGLVDHMTMGGVTSTGIGGRAVVHKKKLISRRYQSQYHQSQYHWSRLV